MEYQIPCECGVVTDVSEGAAGARLPCVCGRTIVVPSLRDLRRQAGLPELLPSPEMAVEALLLAGRLPEENHCVLCGIATVDSVYCHTECERAYTHDGRPPWWVWLLAFLSFGWIGAAVVASSPRQETEWGKDRIFDLPLRICAACRGQLTNAEAVKEALWRVPWYRRLLKKYPNAKVSLLAP